MGKRVMRARKLPGNGRTKEQGVPDALAAVRHKTSFSELRKRPGYVCEHCNAFAFAGTGLCLRHGGANRAKARGLDILPSQKALARRGRDERRRGRLIVPKELKTHPAYRRVCKDPDRARALVDAFGSASFPAMVRDIMKDTDR